MEQKLKFKQILLWPGCRGVKSVIHSSKVKSRTNFFEFARELPPGSGKKTGGPNLEIQGPVFFKSGVLALGWEGGGLQRRRGHLAVGGESLGPGRDPKARLGM